MPDQAPAVVGPLLEHARDALAGAGHLAAVTGLVACLHRAAADPHSSGTRSAARACDVTW